VNREIILNNYLKELGFLKLDNGKINIEKSLAISYGYGDVWLNVKRREPHGIIEPGNEYENVRSKIISTLSKIKVNDECPIKAVERRGLLV
jgi:predicted AlkP superfamily phosphohydrolase/phosphomutase